MVKLPTELEAGSVYSMSVNELDSATRFSYLIIEKAKAAISLIEKGKWDEATQDVIWILRTLNKTNVNYQHLRQSKRSWSWNIFHFGRRLENQLINDLKRLYKDYGHLYGVYQKIKKSRKSAFKESGFQQEIEIFLRDIIKQELLLERVFDSLERQTKKSKGVFFVAVSGGGTTTTCAIANENGEILGKGKAGPTNWDIVGIYYAVANVLKAFKKAVEDAGLNPKKIFVKRMAIGIGVHSKQVHMNYSKIFTKYIRRFSRNIKDVIILRDTTVAWYTGLGGYPGILVIGGTGANVYGYNNGIESSHSRHVKKIGGRRVFVLSGRVLSYYGTKLLLKIRQRGEREVKKSILWQLVEDAYNKRKIFPNSGSLLEALHDIYENYDQFPRIVGKLSPNQAASLGRYVVNAGEAGDRDALKILRKATVNTSYLIAEVANDIGLHNKPFKVTYTGSIMYRKFILHHLKEELLKYEPYAEVIDPIGGDEVQGLLNIARKNIHFY